ncbi:axoneme-associated protein mst101(2) isoform X2 [Dunckerocampus dactyliophorus]|uniref:axoneme-associated protein mst101(2) isoform X2 n=1 Tax=Dunckerocampus dactyliophorus TaxID=161453 RepID=UPI002404F68E|nr:axoneme-associated protein mst101(2) isoform X2 [Dunckerocampus dactyliophorus]
MPGKTCHQFKPGDLVFGKMKGFPHWPARVCKSDDAHKKRVPVFFFGTHQIGHLLPENIVPYSGNKMKYGSGVRIKGFSEGMWEIQNTPGVGSKSKVAANMPSKTTPAKSTAASKTTLPDKTSSARSTPSKRTSAAKATSGVRTTRANLNVDVNSTPAKPECDAETSAVEATSKTENLPAVSTVDLMECMVKCVPPQTSLSVSSAKSQKESNLSKVDDSPRSSSRSATQTPTDDFPQEDSSPNDGTTAEGQRRGRPSKASKEKSNEMTQAAEIQTPPSGAHVTAGCAASMVHCMVKCKKSHSHTGPATNHKEDTASETASTLTRSTRATKNLRRSSSRSTAQSPTEDLQIPQKPSVPKDDAAGEGRTRGRPSKVSGVKQSEDTAGPLISHIDPQSHNVSAFLPKTYDHMTQTAPMLTHKSSSSSSMDGQEEKEPEGENKLLEKMPEEDTIEKIQPGEETQQMKEAEESTMRGLKKKRKNEDEGNKELEEENKQLEENRQLDEEKKELSEESTTRRGVERKRNKDEEKKQLEEEQKELEDKSTASRGVKMKRKEQKKEPEEKRKTARGGLNRKRKNEDEGNNELEEEKKQLEENQQLEEEKKELSEVSTTTTRRGVARKRNEDEEMEKKKKLVEEKKQLERMPEEEQKATWLWEETQKEFEEESAMTRRLERKVEEEKNKQLEEELENKSTASRGVKKKRKEEKEPEEKRKQVEEEQKELEGMSSKSRGVTKKTEDEDKKHLKKEQELEEKSTAGREVKMKRKEEKKKEAEEEWRQVDEKQKELGEDSTANRLQGKRKEKTKTEQRKQVEEQQEFEEKTQPGEKEEQKALTQDSTTRRGIERKRKEAENQQEGSVEGKTEEPMTAEKQSKRRRSEEGGSKRRKREKEAAEESQKDERKKRKEDATEERRGARKRSRKEKDTKGGEMHEEKGSTKKERHVDEERHLAAKRESVLTSLRGLLKESTTNSITKSTSRAKKAARSHKMLKEPSVGRKGVKARGSQLLVKEAKKGHEETLSKKLASHSDGGKIREKTQTDERKLIGKIVKATTKVQVKTMMGGATLLEEQKKKTPKADDTKTQKSSEEGGKPERLATDDKGAKNSGNQGVKSKLRDELEDNQEDRKKGADKIAVSEKDGNAAAKLDKQQSGGRSRKQTTPAAAMQSGLSSGEEAEHNHQQQQKNSNLTLIDSTLHRIHGDIRISLKSDNPDVSKCLAALDQLSGIYVTSEHVQRHSELVSTLRKMRFYRASQDIMDKAAMLYNRFKNAFLLGEDQEVVSAAFLRSLLEEKEHEKAVHCHGGADGCDGAGLEQKRVGGEEQELQRKTPSVD